jgi:hypothetical protein
MDGQAKSGSDNASIYSDGGYIKADLEITP